MSQITVIPDNADPSRLRFEEARARFKQAMADLHVAAAELTEAEAEYSMTAKLKAQPPRDTRVMVRVPEAAERLGLTRTKVYELMARGALPSVKVDGVRCIRVRDLEAFAEEVLGRPEGVGPAARPKKR